jgi:flagellar motor switch protein FliM
MVGNGIRETLAALLGTAVSVRLVEPAVPSPGAWSAIVRDALMYRTRGSVADAAIVLRPADAAALAAAVFGERRNASEPRRELSPLERDVVDRAAAAIAVALPAVCGTRDRETAERVEAIAGFSTYFEIVVDAPIDARIGIAVSRDPAPEPRGRLTLEELAGVTLAPAVTLDAAAMNASSLARLARGTVVPLVRSGALRGTLTVEGRALASGTCGVRRGRYAFTVAGSP